MVVDYLAGVLARFRLRGEKWPFTGKIVDEAIYDAMERTSRRGVVESSRNLCDTADRVSETFNRTSAI